MSDDLLVGIEARKALRGFYVPEDMADMISALRAQAKQIKILRMAIYHIIKDQGLNSDNAEIAHEALHEATIADLRRQLVLANSSMDHNYTSWEIAKARAENAEAELRRLNPLYTAACIGLRDAEAAQRFSRDPTVAMRKAGNDAAAKVVSEYPDSALIWYAMYDAALRADKAPGPVPPPRPRDKEE